MDKKSFLESKLEILKNRRDDAMCNLECSVDYRRTDICFVRELSFLHSSFCFDVYDFKEKHNMFEFQKVNGDYR